MGNSASNDPIPGTVKNSGSPGQRWNWLDEAELRFLRLVAPQLPTGTNGGAYRGKSKLRTLLPNIENEIRNKVVLDFGCGAGAEAIELAQLGAQSVVGLDSSERWLTVAREQAEKSGLTQRCQFVCGYSGQAEVIISLDCFEHFGDPRGILETMHSMLVPGGCILLSFGPTWYHPLGGHLFSVFPWAHVVLREDALIRWRAQFKHDGARRFGEVEGGLNQMTIGRFENLLRESPFVVEQFDLVPIRKLKPLHNRLTREFFTAIVRCKLRKAELATGNEAGI